MISPGMTMVVEMDDLVESDSETFDSNEYTPQSGNSHSVLTPEVAMYCGALQFE
ncbi:unnamed protein product [Bathycoccus prasinos]